MLIERDVANSCEKHKIDLPNGRNIVVNVYGKDLPTTFEFEGAYGMHTEDVESLANALLALVRELKHPEAVQEKPDWVITNEVCNCRWCVEARKKRTH